LPVEVRDGRAFVGPIDMAAAADVGGTAAGSIALVRPHEIEIEVVVDDGAAAAGWRAVVAGVRVIGPIVRLELSAQGRLNPQGGPSSEPLEAEISRERYEAGRFEVGREVRLRFRRWQVYAASGDAAA
jgi:hypothetical protein